MNSKLNLLKKKLRYAIENDNVVEYQKKNCTIHKMDGTPDITYHSPNNYDETMMEKWECVSFEFYATLREPIDDCYDKEFQKKILGKAHISYKDEKFHISSLTKEIIP